MCNALILIHFIQDQQMYFSQRLANLEIHLHGQFGLLLSDIELIVNKLNNRRYVTTAGGHALDIHHSHVVDSKQGVASFRGVGTELAFEDIKFIQCLSTKAETIFKMANSLAKVRADDKNRKVMASLETAVAFSCLSQVANIECKVCFCFIIFSLSRNYLKIKTNSAIIGPAINNFINFKIVDFTL